MKKVNVLLICFLILIVGACRQDSIQVHTPLTDMQELVANLLLYESVGELNPATERENVHSFLVSKGLRVADPYGNDYLFYIFETHYFIISKGEDAELNTNDDVSFVYDKRLKIWTDK